MAYALEDIVKLEDIGITIKSGLKGLVSARFIDMCLDIKYKKGYRVQNGRKRRHSSLAEGLLLESIAQNGATGQSSDIKGANIQCCRCKELDLKMEELESALSLASQPKSFEIIESEFSLESRVVQEYLTNVFQHSESDTQVWFNVKIEKISGKVIAAATGRIFEPHVKEM